MRTCSEKRSRLYLDNAVATVNSDLCPGDKFRGITSKEDDCTLEVFWISHLNVIPKLSAPSPNSIAIMHSPYPWGSTLPMYV